MNIAFLGSGNGSSVPALLSECNRHYSRAKAALVISNVPNAPILKKGPRLFNGPRLTIPSKGLPQQVFEEQLHQALLDHQIDLVCLTGFKRILSETFVIRWLGKLINIHPAVLWRFPQAGGEDLFGIHVHQKMIDIQPTLPWGYRYITGCTVHFVEPDVDRGPIIATGLVRFKPGDGAADLTPQVLKIEKKTYPYALQLVASGDTVYHQGKCCTPVEGGQLVPDLRHGVFTQVGKGLIRKMTLTA